MITDQTTTICRFMMESENAHPSNSKFIEVSITVSHHGNNLQGAAKVTIIFNDTEITFYESATGKNSVAACRKVAEEFLNLITGYTNSYF